MASTFSGLIASPDFLSQLLQTVYHACSNDVTPSHSGTHVNKMPSFTYTPSKELFQLPILWSRGDVYAMDRTGKRGEPCGTPTS